MTTMTVHRKAHNRQSAAGRRLGYAIAVAVNAVLLVLIDVNPGWDTVPFLTDRTPLVLGLVNAGLIASVIVNLIYPIFDPRWFRALGDLVTTSIGLAGMIRIWQVFPFDFGTSSFPWDTAARWAIGVGIFGAALGVLVALVTFFRSLGQASSADS